MTDRFFLANIGSNEISNYFYSHLDKGVLIQFKVFLHHKMPWMVEFLNFLGGVLPLRKFTIGLEIVLKMTMHYLDFVKDSFILSVLWDYITDNNGTVLMTEYHSFPITIFAAATLSISLSEVSNALVVVTHPMHRNKSTLCKFILALCAPFAPAATLLEEMVIRIGMANCNREIQGGAFTRILGLG